MISTEKVTSGLHRQTGRFGEDISLLCWKYSQDSWFVKTLVYTHY